MLCSSCSVRVKPIVAFDLDGVLGDYHGHLHRFAEAYLGRRFGIQMPYKGDIPHREWFEMSGIDNATFRDIKLAYRQGAQKRSMPANRDMIGLVNRLARQGVEIWITTTRPYLRLDNVDPDTRHWLERNEVEFDHLMYDDNKYPKLASMVERSRVIAIIDDELEMVEEAESAFNSGTPILWRNRYNKEVFHSITASSTKELRLMIMDRLARWERDYG
jgi:phosphoglycolate phosphatase-like HAD superfamily hydrolase